MMAKKPSSLLGQPYDGVHIPFSDATTGDAAILMKEFGIDPAGPIVPRWQALAQALAEKYHPDYKAPVGRPAHKTTPYYAMLLGSVEHEKERQNFSSFKAAARWLYDNHPGLLVGMGRAKHIPAFSSIYADFKTARSMKRNGRLW
jgi:hypothetical protein